jgi:hypothetical protein
MLMDVASSGHLKKGHSRDFQSELGGSVLRAALGLGRCRDLRLWHSTHCWLGFVLVGLVSVSKTQGCLDGIALRIKELRILKDKALKNEFLLFNKLN